MHFWKKFWDDSIYQGKRHKKNYFEGWYFKIVDKNEENVYAIIPGVSFNKKRESTSFIQFFDGKEAQMTYFQFNIANFNFSKREFDINIGKNRFNANGLRLDIAKDNTTVKGELKFSKLIPWSSRRYSLGVMNWYRLVPRMECYHGILGFDHVLEGKLVIDDKEIDFTGGRGYIEKDYGRSFPHYYLWLQSNHFDVLGTSLMASFAKIPWMGSAFDGFVVGLYHEGKVHRFATYTGAKVTKLIIGDQKIIMHFADKKKRLEIEATKSESVNLPSPVEGSMTGRILESITAEVEVNLVDLRKREEKIIFEGKGRNAGLDMGGRVEEIKEIH